MLDASSRTCLVVVAQLLESHWSIATSTVLWQLLTSGERGNSQTRMRSTEQGLYALSLSLDITLTPTSLGWLYHSQNLLKYLILLLITKPNLLMIFVEHSMKKWYPVNLVETRTTYSSQENVLGWNVAVRFWMRALGQFCCTFWATYSKILSHWQVPQTTLQNSSMNLT